MTYWHNENPWADKVVYVPAEELAEALSGGTIKQPDGSVVEMDASFYINAWDRLGEIDVYIIKGDAGYSAGVRYGAEPHEYLSPHASAEASLQAVYERHCGRIHPLASVRNSDWIRR